MWASYSPHKYFWRNKHTEDFNNVSTDYPNDEWFSIYTAEFVGSTVQIGQY